MKRKEAYVKVVKYVPSLKANIETIKKNKKKIYMKLVWKLRDYDVWIVNGKFLRTNVCEDFINFGQYYHYKFIPKNELWIDEEAVPGEIEFYISHLLVENRLMKMGIGYDEAFEKAKRVEKKERARSSVGRELRKNKKQNLIKEIHKKLWKDYSNDKLKVWIVSGEIVRDFYEINFGGGTHDEVDNFVPNGEIWIDDDIFSEERKFILVHEMHERRMMEKGENYLQAHKLATKVEDYVRHYPKKIDNELKKELELQP